MITGIDPLIVPYDNLIRTLCKTPYHGHSKGCLNYGKNKGCPPQKLIKDVFDLNKELYVIFTEFSVGEFAERMRLNHPEWREFTYPDNPAKSFEIVQGIEDDLKERHPEWTDYYFVPKITESWTSSRQWYNPRLWQPSARKEHRTELDRFISENQGLGFDMYPEAHGVNLTGLMHELGIELKWQWPPAHDIKNKSYIISIGGHLLNH